MSSQQCSMGSSIRRPIPRCFPGQLVGGIWFSWITHSWILTTSLTTVGFELAICALHGSAEFANGIIFSTSAPSIRLSHANKRWQNEREMQMSTAKYLSTQCVRRKWLEKRPVKRGVFCFAFRGYYQTAFYSQMLIRRVVIACRKHFKERHSCCIPLIWRWHVPSL